MEHGPSRLVLRPRIEASYRSVANGTTLAFGPSTRIIETPGTGQYLMKKRVVVIFGWLKQHPGIATVAGDRCRLCADGATLGAPRAADRRLVSSH
jgi:hypothetical protein